MYEELKNLTTLPLKNMKTSPDFKNEKKLSLTNDFNNFVEHHTKLSDENIQYIKNLFAHGHIKKTLRISLVILIWSFINSFFDVTLIGWGMLETAVTRFSILNFVPWFLMLATTFTAKYLFITYTDERNSFSTTQRILCALPSVGVFFFLSSVFAKEKLMLKITRQYLHHVRKRGLASIFKLLSKAMPIK